MPSAYEVAEAMKYAEAYKDLFYFIFCGAKYFISLPTILHIAQRYFTGKEYDNARE